MVAYFLQVNVCWLLFYGAYYALLSKETFFWLNRIWLVVSLLCGLALPFVADYFAVKVVPTNLFVMTLEPFVVSATALQRNLAADTEGVVLKALAMVYALGVAVLAARFLAGLFLIFKLFLQSKREKKDGFLLVFTEGGIPPFSFFRFIFINPNEFDSVDFQQIMQHEQAHVRQRHSFDVVFMELLNILFWCSPLVYLYKTSLRNVHEYLADEAVLRTNTTPQYGRLLLRQQQSGVALSLTSNISNHFFSQLKKRILMMTRNKSKRTALIKYALAAPIFLILTAALASPKLPILAKTEVLGDKVVKTIGDKIIDNQEVKTLNNNNLAQKTTPQYFGASVDTTFKPLSELKLVDEKQIAQMNVDTKEEFNTQITITFKDGHIERYKGTKAEMEKAFKTENDAAAQKTNDQKLAEMVVVGRSTNKNLSEQRIQNVEEVPKGGQQKDKNLTEKTLTDPVFTIVEQSPEFVGGQALLFKWLGENIRYPKSARDAGAQGTVYVGFFVEKDGSITNVNVKRDVPVIIRDTITISEVNGIKGNKIVERTEYTLGKEAVRVISAMPNWKPGKSNGMPVRVSYTLPIKFKLD
jgi:beta-lactamase regulating signal transducer with metallopeptidase domain